MDTLRRLYMIVVQNIRKAREKLPKKEDEPHNFKVNDMVLVKDPDAAVFEPRYQPNFRVTAIFGNNRIEVQDERGHKSIRRSANVKYIAPSEKVAKQLPSEEVLKNYGRSSKLLLAENDIPNLHFDAEGTKDKSKLSETADVMEIMNVDTKENAQNSDSREHSRNSLESVAGGALDRMNQHRNVEKTIGAKLLKGTSEYRELSQESRSSEKVKEASRKLVKRTFSRDTHPEHSESREHSQNSQKKQAGEDTGNIKVTLSAKDNKRSAVSSDFLEDSQNSLSSGECEAKEGEAKVSFSDRDDQCLVMASEFRELSPNSRVVTECSEGTQKKQHTKPLCIIEPSEYSWDSLGGVGNNVSVPSFSWFKSMSQIVGLTATWQQDKVEGNPTGASTVSNAKTNSNPVQTEFNFFL